METPRVTDAEMALLSLLWEQSPQGASDLTDALADSRGWSLNTVKTMLARLVTKGAIVAKKDGRRFLYAPKVERETVASGQALSLLDRLFDGRLSPLVAHLAEQREIDPQDLDELEALVRELKK